MSTKIYIFFIVGAIIGFLFHFIFDGKKEGDNLHRSIRFLVGDYYVHLHHWLYSVVIVLVLYYFDWDFPFVYGFLTGSIMQGLTYRDWYLFVYHKDDFEKIYSKWRSDLEFDKNKNLP